MYGSRLVGVDIRIYENVIQRTLQTYVSTGKKVSVYISALVSEDH